MASINQFWIIGNVTKDVELRYTPGGTASATYTVAVDNVYYDRERNKHEETDFIPVTTYGKQAENDAKYLKKGSAVAVQGRIRSWYNADKGKGGFNFEAERVQYLGKPGGRAGEGETDPWLRDYERAGDQDGAPAGKGARRR